LRIADAHDLPNLASGAASCKKFPFSATCAHCSTVSLCLSITAIATLSLMTAFKSFIIAPWLNTDHFLQKSSGVMVIRLTARCQPTCHRQTPNRVKVLLDLRSWAGRLHTVVKRPLCKGTGTAYALHLLSDSEPSQSILARFQFQRICNQVGSRRFPLCRCPCTDHR